MVPQGLSPFMAVPTMCRAAVLPCRRTDGADRGQHVHCLEMLAPRESVGELITSRWTGARIDMRGYHARLNDSNTFSIIVEGASTRSRVAAASPQRPPRQILSRWHSGSSPGALNPTRSRPIGAVSSLRRSSTTIRALLQHTVTNMVRRRAHLPALHACRRRAHDRVLAYLCPACVRCRAQAASTAAVVVTTSTLGTGAFVLPALPPQNGAQCRAAIVAASSTPRCRFRRRRPAAAAVMSTRRRRSAAARRFRSVCCRTCHLVVAADSTRSGRLGCGGQSRRGRMDRRGSVSQGPPWPPPRRAHDRENMLRTCVPECPNVVSNSLAPAVPECMCAKAARRES
jgi:hypothetical protein